MERLCACRFLFPFCVTVQKWVVTRESDSSEQEFAFKYWGEEKGVLLLRR